VDGLVGGSAAPAPPKPGSLPALSVDDPVETWPFEGILTAVERGTLPDWQRLAAAIRADPWGPVAQQVLEAVEMSRPYGTGELLTTWSRVRPVEA
jgi:hypothetical protein